MVIPPLREVRRGLAFVLVATSVASHISSVELYLTFIDGEIIDPFLI